MKSLLLRTLIAALIITLYSCGQSHPNITTQNPEEAEPIVKEGGKLIEFAPTSSQIKIFATEQVKRQIGAINFSAPATVVGKVHRSDDPVSGNIILFYSVDLTNIYSTYLQNKTLKKTAKINFDRVSDLFKHGAATGKDLNDASSELLNIQTSLAGNEAVLRESGLNPENLNTSQLGTVWLICDLPESELNMIKKGQKQNLTFTSFPNETFSANVDIIADVMDAQTRKIRIRLSMYDKSDKIRPGMFAEVSFESMHNGIMVSSQSVISANARYYVFVKKSANVFERREVKLSSEDNGLIEIANGLSEGEEIVSSNVYLLKGIDIGI